MGTSRHTSPYTLNIEVIEPLAKAYVSEQLVDIALEYAVGQYEYANDSNSSRE
jgi:hypothetical protein